MVVVLVVDVAAAVIMLQNSLLDQSVSHLIDIFVLPGLGLVVGSIGSDVVGRVVVVGSKKSTSQRVIL